MKKVTLYNRETGESVQVLDFHANYMMKVNPIWADSMPEVAQEEVKEEIEEVEEQPKTKPLKRSRKKVKNGTDS
jgi:hypothetical protein